VLGLRGATQRDGGPEPSHNAGEGLYRAGAAEGVGGAAGAVAVDGVAEAAVPARGGGSAGWKTSRLSPLTLVDLGKLRTVKLSGALPTPSDAPKGLGRLQTIR
jgi:hypothetical protein